MGNLKDSQTANMRKREMKKPVNANKFWKKAEIVTLWMLFLLCITLIAYLDAEDRKTYKEDIFCPMVQDGYWPDPEEECRKTLGKK